MSDRRKAGRQQEELYGSMTKVLLLKSTAHVTMHCLQRKAGSVLRTYSFLPWAGIKIPTSIVVDLIKSQFLASHALANAKTHIPPVVFNFYSVFLHLQQD